MIKIHKDPIVMRRLVNQHNIECYCEGKRSEYCEQDYTWCMSSLTPFPFFSCNRCWHRDDMMNNPDRAFIGFIPQKIREY